MTNLPTIEITPTVENLPGTTLVGDDGGLSFVNGNVYASSTRAGMLVAETEHGTLYLDPDLPVEILADEAEPLTRPLTPAEIQARADEDGTLTAVLAVSLNDLITGDLDAFNDEASERITGSIVGLLDIAYAVVGHQGGEVLLAVTADASDFLAEHDLA